MANGQKQQAGSTRGASSNGAPHIPDGTGTLYQLQGHMGARGEGLPDHRWNQTIKVNIL